MELAILRFSSGKNTTLGVLHDVTPQPFMSVLKKKFLAYSLEDEFRTFKKFGETRISGGRYKLGLRTFGGFHERYLQRFPAIHKGMIEVLDVPDFTDILWHIGNTEDDTSGCTLFGDQQMQNITSKGHLIASEVAYLRVYSYVIDAVIAGDAYVTYIDYDLTP